MRYRIRPDSTHYSRRDHIPQLILTEVHARCRHCQRQRETVSTLLCVWVGTVGDDSPQGRASGKRNPRAGERTFGGFLTSPIDHEGVPYGLCHYTAFPVHPPLAREATTPNTPLTLPRKPVKPRTLMGSCRLHFNFPLEGEPHGSCLCATQTSPT